MRWTMMPILLGVIGLLFLSIGAGCNASPKRWYKPGATRAQFQQDKEWCEQALLTRAGTLTTKFYTFEDCMEMKGWQPIDESRP